jgi:3'-phosphoadenosine 5'-phosphosulfate sulfotransferase (PAPS reductase)/FAD synthetase
MRDPFKIDSPTCISFSGGRTSAYMLWRYLQSNGGFLPKDAVVCFANTGKEMAETLYFVKECSDTWKVPIVWLEYRDNDDGGSGYKVVNFHDCSREGEPFESLIKKRNYLPNPVTRFCTVELKIRVIHKFLKSHGWLDGDGYEMATGIRSDEQRRIVKIRARGTTSESAKVDMILPLADAGVTKKEVGDFWRSQPFDLRLENNNGVTMHGNCDLCFLKGAKQVYSLIQEKPDRAIWWAKMESTPLASKPSGAVFRSDRPTYQSMRDYALAQLDMFAGTDDETIECFCGD